MIPAFALYPPELNSALMFAGAGSGPLFGAASAWDGLASDLSGAAASFDSVLLFHTLTYAAQPQQALEECARVLRPNGRLVVLALDAHEHKEVTAAYGERQLRQGRRQRL